jgi:hypothetical protein
MEPQGHAGACLDPYKRYEMRGLSYLFVIIVPGVLAGCGGASPTRPVTVSGAYDNEVMKTQASCSGVTVVIALSRPDGHEIAKQNSSVTWRDGLCLFPFSFGHVKPMSSYGVRIAGITPNAWLTPQQIASPALLSVYDGHYVGVLSAGSAFT